MDFGGGPEMLVQYLMSNLSSGINIVHTNMDSMDNEMVVQTLFETFKIIISMPLFDIRTGILNDLLDSINMAMVSIGYRMHHKQIPRSELSDTIYYSRLTPDGQLLRSNYHPLYIRSFMNPGEIPETFENIYSNQAYLPNIVNVWDRGHSESLMLISYQKVNLHFNTPSDNGEGLELD